MLRQKSITFRAMDALGLKRAAAIGHLVMFWSAVSQCGTNGLVADCSDAQLEEWGGWEGTRGRFAKFIRDSHLDESGRVREWDDYAGTLETRREKDRQRQRDKRERERTDVRVTSDGHPRDVTETSAPTIRYDTKRDERTTKAGRVRAPDPEWVALAGAQWAAKIGHVKPSRIKAALSLTIGTHGWDVVSKAMADYLTATPGSKARIEWFAERGAYWIKLSSMPLMDPQTSRPTERYQVVVEGKAA